MDPQTQALLQMYMQRFGGAHPGVVGPQVGAQPVQSPGMGAGLGGAASQLAQAYMLANRQKKLRSLQPIQVTAQKIPIPNQGVDTSTPVQSDAAAAPVTE